MARLLLVIALAILLLPAKHSAKDLPVREGALLVDLAPVALDERNPHVRSVGPFRSLGNWVLTSRHKDFGGISSMIVTDEGSMLALSDGAALMGFDLPSSVPGKEPRPRQFIAPLPQRPETRRWPNWTWDSESMLHDPVSGRYWVGFELLHWICRYSPGFARVESCAAPHAMRNWPNTGGAEAMARLPDGRFLVFAEMAYSGEANRVLLFDGDPTERTTPPPANLLYHAPRGYRPTDAVVLTPGRLLVLNRRVTLYEGFTAVIAQVDLPPLREGAQLIGKPVARLAPPLLADNFEAMALSREKARTILWLASDDNHQFFQRSLLLKFEVPEEMLR